MSTFSFQTIASTSKAPPYTGPVYHPPDDCNECNMQFISVHRQTVQMPHFNYKSQISDIEARDKLRAMAKTLNEDRGYLKEIWTRKEKLIRLWWSRMSHLERESILNETELDLFISQWGEGTLIAANQYNFSLTTAMKQQKHWCVAPGFTREGICEDPANFLNLIQNRIRYSPAMFAASDSYRLDFAWDFGALEMNYNIHCVDMQSEDYGELVPFDYVRAHSWDIVGYPRAECIIKGQVFMMHGLRTIVREFDRISSLDTTVIPAMDNIDLGNKTANDSYSIPAHIRQDFGPPLRLSFKSLVSIAQTTTDKLSDHVASLRTDYQYMSGIAEVYHSIYEPWEGTQDCHSLVAKDLAEEFHDLRMWMWLLETAQCLQNINSEVRTDVRRGQPLPEKLASALSGLEMNITCFINMISEQLDNILEFHEGFRQNITRSAGLFFNRAPAVKEPDLFHKDPLRWVLGRMLLDPSHKRIVKHAVLFEFLENHLASCTDADRDRLNSVLYKKYSQLAALHKMRDMILVCRPRAPCRTLASLSSTESGRKFSGLLTWLEKSREMLLEEVHKGTLGRKLQSYYIAVASDTKPRTPPQYNFWNYVRYFQEKIFQQLSEDDETDAQVLDKLWSTPIGDEETPQSDSRHDSDSDSVHADNSHQAVEQSVTVTENTKSDTFHSLVGDKLVNGILQSEDALAITKKPAAPTKGQRLTTSRVWSTSKRKVPVSKHDYETLRVLYQDFDKATSMKWKTFLQVMQHIGFDISPAGGSHCDFTPGKTSKWAGMPTIQFDDPHPKKWWPKYQVLNAGKRLHDRMGISLGTFVIKEKTR